MTHYQEIVCPDCGSNHLMKAGRSASGMQRYRCDNIEYTTKSFMLAYHYRAYEPGINAQLVDRHGRGIRDTARVLKINKNTVIRTLKKGDWPRASYPPID